MSDHMHLPDEREPASRNDDLGEPRPPGFWRSGTGLATIGFLAIGGFFLVAEHRAHLLPYLGYAFPFLLILACLPMHFMHGGHGNHGGAKPDDRSHDDDTSHDQDKTTTHHH